MSARRALRLRRRSFSPQRIFIQLYLLFISLLLNYTTRRNGKRIRNYKYAVIRFCNKNRIKLPSPLKNRYSVQFASRNVEIARILQIVRHRSRRIWSGLLIIAASFHYEIRRKWARWLAGIDTIKVLSFTTIPQPAITDYRLSIMSEMRSGDGTANK